MLYTVLGTVKCTKGERYTMLTKKDQEGEDMKRTYVNLKPLRKYGAGLGLRLTFSCLPSLLVYTSANK